MRQSWTDDRLDALNEKVDLRFDEVDRRFDQVDRRFDQADRETQRRFDEVDRRLDGVDERFAGFRTDIREMTSRLDSLQHAVIYLAVSLTAGIVAGFAAICVLIATQL